MNHLFKSRKTCPSNELTHTWQLAWTDKTNSSYSCSKHQQIRQSIQMPLADRLLLIQHAQYKIMTTSTYTISTNKVPISLAEFVKVLPTCEYMLIQGLSTLGGLVLLIQMFHLQWLQLDIYHNKVSTILMEAFPLYKSIGPAVANFFQEHITYQFGSPHKITNNKLNSIH